MALLVPFGFKDGVLYEPQQVSNGKECGCFCPGCKHPLIARQNAQTPHFAHAVGEDCKQGFETAVHLAAKQLIAERLELSLPPAVIHYPGGYGERPSTQPLYTYNLKTLSEVRIEPWLDGFRPDIVVVEAGKQMEILVEIAVTHWVDVTKLQKIKKRGVHTIEIDVSKAREKMDFALLNQFLFDVPSQAKWLYHPEVEQYENEYVEKRKKEWEAQKQALEASEQEKAEEALEQEKAEEALEQEQSDRFEAYRMLNPKEKIRRNLINAEISGETLKALATFVPGEKSYIGGRYAWQSAVLAYIVKQVEEQGVDGKSYFSHFESDEVAYWLAKLFDINALFPDAEKIALWKYLKHLETLGILKQQSKSFEILMLPKEF